MSDGFLDKLAADDPTGAGPTVVPRTTGDLLES
jgi:hypothetical protein